jgi:hypothetical protein
MKIKTMLLYVAVGVGIQLAVAVCFLAIGILSGMELP